MSDSQFSPESCESLYDIIIEEDRKKFICKHAYCGKVFRFRSEIERHVTIHSASRPFKCRYDNCIKTFKRSDALDNHIRCSHTREATYICPFPGCEMSFAAHGSFRHHVQKNHKSSAEESMNQEQSNSPQTVKKVKLNQTEKQVHIDQSNKEMGLENDFFMPKVPSYNNSTLQWQISNDDTVSTTETNKTEQSEKMNQISEENTSLKQRLITNEKAIKCMQNQINNLLSSFFAYQSRAEAQPENSTFQDSSSRKDSFLPEDFLELSKGEEVTLSNIISYGEDTDFFANLPNSERDINFDDAFSGFGPTFEFEKNN